MKILLMLFIIISYLPTHIYSKELTLFDLRIPEKDYTSELQDIRQHKLETHEHMGKITLGLATATVLTAIIAKRNVRRERAARGGLANPADADNFNLHMVSAGLTLASYFTTAYYSISAPKADVMEDIDSVKWHKRLAYVHMPIMIIAPFLGLKAINDYKKGRNPRGVARLHQPLMLIGFAALASATYIIEFE